MNEKELNTIMSVVTDPIENVYKIETHKDLEVILVDDCSKDETFSIMQEYAEKDSRVKAIRNSVNRGAGFSRNQGIDIATGSYITFVVHFLTSKLYFANIVVFKYNLEENIAPCVYFFNIINWNIN